MALGNAYKFTVKGGNEMSDDEFEQVRVDSVERQAVGPDGEQRPWMDNVIVVRRRAR